MTPSERLSIIRSLVQENGRVSVMELSQICDVTEETMRKDLNKLEKEGILTRVHGGAIANQASQMSNVHYNTRKDTNLQEKRVIGKHIKEILDGKRTIFADSSSTVMESLKMLPNDVELTMVTHSTVAFQELADKNIRIICAGGEFNVKTQSLQGSVTKENLRKYNVDAALISCKTIDMVRGVQDSNEGESEIKKVMIEHAQKVYLLVDHSKFNKTSFVSLLDINDVDCIITDRYPGEEWENYLNNKDIRLIYGH